jgi:hypothetical protein
MGGAGPLLLPFPSPHGVPNLIARGQKAGKKVDRLPFLRFWRYKYLLSIDGRALGPAPRRLRPCPRPCMPAHALPAGARRHGGGLPPPRAARGRLARLQAGAAPPAPPPPRRAPPPAARLAVARRQRRRGAQDSKWFEHFYHLLQPWEHFVPVKEDLSDALDRLRWAKANDARAREIAQAVRALPRLAAPCRARGGGLTRGARAAAQGRALMREHMSPEQLYCYYFQASARACARAPAAWRPPHLRAPCPRAVMRGRGDRCWSGTRRRRTSGRRCP